jgi:GNAT superfamily N-acetyltransferase
LTLRRARREDVPAIVGLLAEDEIAGGRENAEPPLDDGYWSAYEEISRDDRSVLIVAEVDGEVVGTLQVNFLRHLTNRGAERAQLEAVRVAARHRGGGLGRAMVEEAIDLARRRGCLLVQLTSDKRREDAHRFYEQLGFRATHEGMRLHLT